MKILLAQIKKDLTLEITTNRQALMALNTLSTLVFISIMAFIPIRNGDGFIWIPLAKNFFGEIASNVGQHRPLFGFITFLISLPVRAIPIDFKLKILEGAPNLNNYIEVSGLDAKIIVSWMISNYLFYLLAINLAYLSVRKFFPDKNVALLFAIFVLISGEMIGWLNNIPIMVQGTAIIYISLYMLCVFLKEKSQFIKKQQSWQFGLVFGILMLGKAEYGILISVFFSVLIFYRKELKNLLRFTLGQFIPLISWYLILNIFGKGYAVYEVSRSDYKIIDYWRSILQFDSVQSVFYSLVSNPISKGTTMSFAGLGIIVTFSAILTIGFFSRENLGKFLAVYVLATVYFLHLVNFLMPRHTFELAPIGYLGLSILMAKMIEKQQALKARILIGTCIALCLTCFLYLNFLRGPILVGDPTVISSIFL